MIRFLPRLRLPRPQSTVSQLAFLAAIVLLGLAVRLYLAPLPGNEFDVGVNQGWGRSAVELGLARSYDEQVNGNMLPNYAPFSIMLFAGMGHIQQEFFGGNFDDNPMSYRILIKIPAIVAELAMIVLFYWLIKKWKGPRAGLLAALICALHPAIIHNGAVWGQTDSIFTFFMVASIGAFIVKRPLLAGSLFTLALLSKMQAVMLAPLMLLLFVRGGVRVFLDGLLGALIVLVPVFAPFALGGTLDTVVNVYIGSVGYYAIVSSAAYNFWWSLLGDKAGEIQDTETFLFLSYKKTGLLLFSLTYLLALLPMYRLRLSHGFAQMLPRIAYSGALISLGFFLWNTQMHERYLFPFVALALPIIFIDRKSALLYAWVSLLFFINLLGWLPASDIDRKAYEMFPALDILVASLQTVMFFQLTWHVVQYVRKNPLPKKKTSKLWNYLKRTRLPIANRSAVVQ